MSKQAQSRSVLAILTGDLLRSSRRKVAEWDQARLALAEGMARFGAGFPGALGSAPAWFRGDGWQVAVVQPHLALRAALYAQAALRVQADMATRVAIGIGSVERYLPDDLGRGVGPAFELAGRALDDRMPRADRFWLEVQYPQPATPCIADLVRIAGRLSAVWTVAQARSVLEVLGEASQRSAAMRLGVKQATVQAALHAADWPLVRIALERFEIQDFESS